MIADISKQVKVAETICRANPGDHADTLGLYVHQETDAGIVLGLNYHAGIVGDPRSGVVSGGAITSLLDTCGGIAAMGFLEQLAPTPTIDMRIDYLKPATAGKTIYGVAECYRKSRHVLFVRGVAYQGSPDQPIACMVATYMNISERSDLAGFERQLLENFPHLPESPSRQSEAASLSGLDQKTIVQARQQRSAQLLLEYCPYARLLGMREGRDGQGRCFSLMPEQSLVGNATLPAIHGGAIGGFMETSALLHVMMESSSASYPKVIDIRIDYIRPGYLKETFARCAVHRIGSKVVSLEVSAWQESEASPIAKASLQVLID